MVVSINPDDIIAIKRVGDDGKTVAKEAYGIDEVVEVTMRDKSAESGEVKYVGRIDTVNRISGTIDLDMSEKYHSNVATLKFDKMVDMSAPKTEEPKQETPAQEQPKQEVPAEQPAQEQPKAEEPKQETPAHEQPVVEEPKQETPAQEQPKQEQPVVEEPKAQEQPKAEEPKQETPAQNPEG